MGIPGVEASHQNYRHRRKSRNLGWLTTKQIIYSYTGFEFGIIKIINLKWCNKNIIRSSEARLYNIFFTPREVYNFYYTEFKTCIAILYIFLPIPNNKISTVFHNINAV